MEAQPELEMEATGFIGLGAMGCQMAANLADALRGQPLTVYNRSPDKAITLAAAVGAPSRVAVAPSVAALADACAVIHVMLSDDAACEEVAGAILGSGGSEGRVIVNHSTVHPDCARRLHDRAREAGAEYVGCPVFGRPDAAAARKLLVVPAGSPEVLRRIQPNLRALGRVLPSVGDESHKANVLKLTGNFMIASVIEMLSEGMALAEKHGVGRDAVVEFVEAFFPAPPIVGYARRIAADDFDAGSGFTVDLALKDVRYMRQLAEAGRAPLPLADLAFNNLLSAAAAGHGRRDWGAIALAVRQAAGLPALEGRRPPASGAGSSGAGAGGSGPAADGGRSKSWGR